MSPQRLEEIMKRTRKTDAEKVIKKMTDYLFIFFISTKGFFFPCLLKVLIRLPVFLPYNELIDSKVKQEVLAH